MLSFLFVWLSLCPRMLWSVFWSRIEYKIVFFYFTYSHKFQRDCLLLQGFQEWILFTGRNFAFIKGRRTLEIQKKIKMKLSEKYSIQCKVALNPITCNAYLESVTTISVPLRPNCFSASSEQLFYLSDQLISFLTFQPPSPSNQLFSFSTSQISFSTF